MTCVPVCKGIVNIHERIISGTIYFQKKKTFPERQKIVIDPRNFDGLFSNFFEELRVFRCKKYIKFSKTKNSFVVQRLVAVLNRKNLQNQLFGIGLKAFETTNETGYIDPLKLGLTCGGACNPCNLSLFLTEFCMLKLHTNMAQ